MKNWYCIIFKKATKNNRFSVQFIFILILLLLFNFPYKTLAQEKFTVVLDAGHGGKDPGRPADKYIEKEIALNIVLLLGKRLEKINEIKVIYTRQKDVFVELKERGNIANKADADLFVSIHSNAHDTQAYGTETWVLGVNANKKNFEVAQAENEVILLEDNYKENYKGFDPNSPESVIGLTLMQEEYLDESLLLASYVQDNFRNDLHREDRGVKQEAFIVLYQSYMPSILVETGFITNKKEGAFLNSKKGQQDISNAIYEAIIKYKKHLDDNFVVEEPPKLIVQEPKEKIFKGIDFKVQIASSSKKLDLKAYNFSGLKGVERLKVGSHYKYYFGKSSNYTEIKNIQQEAKKAGFKSAFIVAYKNDTRISVSELLNPSQK